MTLVTNSVVTLPLFQPGLQTNSQLQSATALGWYQFILFGEQKYMYVNDLPRVDV